MLSISPENLLLFVSCSAAFVALLDALFCYSILRQERKWVHIGADIRSYYKGKIIRRLLAAFAMAILAGIAVSQGAHIP